MKPDIDLIVKDLLTTEPELGIEADSLRAIVIELAKKQPVVEVDATFRHELRTKLLYEIETQKAKRVRLPWWLIYTVPVGVTAVLLLVVQPTPVSSPIVPTATDSFDSAPALFETGVGRDARSLESAGIVDDTTMYSEPATTQDFFTAAFTPDRTAVRLTYVSISAPAFIRITDSAGEVFMSDLLPSGEQTNLELVLDTPVLPGTIYTVTLHYDNGDGVFGSDDRPVLDASGIPIAMSLVP